METIANSGKYEWHWVHDFFHGFGMREYTPDNEIVIEDLTDYTKEHSIPCKVVRSKQKEKYIWLRQAERWLGITDLRGKTNEELYDIYERLQPHIEKHLEYLRSLPPATYDRIYVPKVNKEYPQL